MTAIWAGSAFLAALAFGWRAAALIALAVAVVVLTRRRRSDLAPALLIVLLAGVGAGRAPAVTVPIPPQWLASAHSISGTIISPPTNTGRSQGFTVQISQVGDVDLRDSKPRACITMSVLPRVRLHDQVWLAGEPQAMADQAQATRGFMRSRGCEVTMFAVGVELELAGEGWRRALAEGRVRFSQVLQGAALGDAGALLSGLVTGDDNALSRNRQTAFLRTGTSHITAVSGSNVALVVTILALAGHSTGWRRQLGWQIAVVALIWAYAVAVGAEAPVIRAALVANAMLLALRFGRKGDPLTLIVLAAVLMTALAPDQIRSLSFQLSFAASLGIVLALNGTKLTGRWPAVQALIRASVAAQIATMPILWLALGQVSLISLVANVMISPLVALAMPLAAVAGALGLIWPPLAIAAILPARLLVEAIFLIVEGLSRLPGAMVLVGVTPPAFGVILSVTAIAVVATMSADAARFVRRLPLRASDDFGAAQGRVVSGQPADQERM